MTVPKKCNVTSVFYTGDMGGILCGLDMGGTETDYAHVVSITHLAFDRPDPLLSPYLRLSAPSNQETEQQQGRGY